METKKDRIFLFIAFALGFLFFDWIFFSGLGISLPIYMALFYAAAFWYLHGKHGGASKKGFLLLVPIALLSAGFALYNNMLLGVLSSFLLAALVILQLATLSGNRLYQTFSAGLLIDLFHTGAALPLVNLPAPFRLMKRKPDAARKNGIIGRILIGLAISLPLMAVALVLLSSADPLFEKALNKLFGYMNENVWAYAGKAILGALAAIPLFGLLHALRNNRKLSVMKLKIDADRVKVLDSGIGSTVLVLLNAVYLAFIVIQFGYLFGAFTSALPQGFSYAEYARRGFFELMGVSVLNLCVLSASLLFSRRGGRGGMLLKLLETALVTFTLLLIASAMAKMALYMDAYGLTLLRVYVAWFLMVLAVFFVSMLVKLYVRKFALTRCCAIAFVALFLALNYVDVDARIAQYNIGCYMSGKFKTVDVEMFRSLSDSMVPYAAVLLDDCDKAVAAKAKEMLTARASTLNDNRWQVFSIARENARRTLADRGIGSQAE